MSSCKAPAETTHQLNLIGQHESSSRIQKQALPVSNEVRKNVMTLLKKNGSISGEKFQSMYRNEFGEVLNYKLYGFNKLTPMLMALGVQSRAFRGPGPGPNSFFITDNCF